MTDTQDSWPVDESWIPAQDESLEAFVRSWVLESSRSAAAPELAKINLNYFPAEVLNAMECVRATAEVEAVAKDGGLYSRHPTYAEIYVATANCGLKVLRDHNLNVPSRLDRLFSDDTQKAVRRVVIFTNNWILHPRHERFQARLPKALVGQAHDFADQCSIHPSAAITACFVAGIAQSEEWLMPHGKLRSRWVSRCESSIQWFWSVVESEGGLW